MADEEEATPEQKLNIANYFIMSAPPGQVDDVLYDVSKLVGDDSILTNDAITTMLSSYNQQQYVHFDVEGGKTLVSPYGQIDGQKFVNPSTSNVMVVDHRTRKATASAEKQTLSSDIEKYRSTIESKLKGYLEAHYKKNKAILGVYGSDDGEITICISAINKNLSNFWSGGWRGTFKISVKKKGSADFTSHTKIHCHYFEDGNVQLHAEKEKKVSVKVADPAATADEIFKAISKWETDYQAHLEDMYVDMHNITFKNMRRLLPKTKQPMNWSSGAHSLASELMKG